MTFLIDTNVISEIMRRKPDLMVWDWFAGLDEIFISSITVDEIFFGLSRRSMVQKMTWFLNFIREKAVVVPVDEPIARWSGEKRAEQESSGRPGTMADYLIAATAHEKGFVLATRNTRDFENCGIALFNPFSSPR